MCTETNKGACAFNKDEIKWRMEMWYEVKDDNGDHYYVENNETKEKTYINVIFLNTTNLKLIPRIGESVATDGVLYEVKDVVYDYDRGVVKVEAIWKHPVDCGCDECDFEHCWKNDEKFKKFKKNNFECLPKDFFSLPRKAQDMILEDVETDRKKRCGEDEECVVENTTKNIYGDIITASAANVIDEIYQDVANEIKNDCAMYNETRYAKSLLYAERLKNIFSGKSQELMDAVDRYDEKEELKKHVPKEKRGDIKKASCFMDIVNKYYEKHKKEIQDYTKKNLELDKCHEGDEAKFTIECSDCTDATGLGTGIVGTPKELENIVMNHSNITYGAKKYLVNNPYSWNVGDKFIYRMPYGNEDNPMYNDWHEATIVITDIFPAFHAETFDLTIIFIIKNLKTGEERKLNGIEFDRLTKITENKETPKQE